MGQPLQVRSSVLETRIRANIIILKIYSCHIIIHTDKTTHFREQKHFYGKEVNAAVALDRKGRRVALRQHVHRI